MKILLLQRAVRQRISADTRRNLLTPPLMSGSIFFNRSKARAKTARYSSRGVLGATGKLKQFPPRSAVPVPG